MLAFFFPSTEAYFLLYVIWMKWFSTSDLQTIEWPKSHPVKDTMVKDFGHRNYWDIVWWCHSEVISTTGARLIRVLSCIDPTLPPLQHYIYFLMCTEKEGTITKLLLQAR